jgi:hypothetical protein
MSDVLLVLHSGLRSIDESEAIKELPSQLLHAPRKLIRVDTGAFKEHVDVGDWSGQGQYLREMAANVQRAADGLSDPQIHYFGLAEVPHVLAFGAAYGTERRMIVHEYDRDAQGWQWPATSPSVGVAVDNVPQGPPISAKGHAVLRICVSAEIHDHDVQAVVEDPLADVTVRLDGTLAVGRIRHAEDVERIRTAFREALASILQARSGVEVLHLFVAAPVSVSFAIGQELVPRNGPPIQTYRYRKSQSGPSLAPAILISNEVDSESAVSLTESDIAVATQIRSQRWPAVLEQVHEFAGELGRSPLDIQTPWYSVLEPAADLAKAAPFASLPCLSFLIHDRDGVAPEPYHLDYGHDSTRHVWLLGDRLLANLAKAGDSDDEAVASIIRMFLFHEYVHVHHSLTKYMAVNVGKFPNALERVDYSADTYAIFHELNYRLRRRRGIQPDEMINALRDQLDQVLRSFWAFEGSTPHKEMQTRRLRRYLNWYWRHAQLERAKSIIEAVCLFARSPAVELAGLRMRTDGERRVFSRFVQIPGRRLELAILSEDERIVRVGDGDASPMEDLVSAFQRGDHGALKQWFRPVFELVERQALVFPRLHPLIETQN